MDYEITFIEDEQAYRVVMGYEFSVIGDWISETLTQKETLQKTIQQIRFAELHDETTRFTQGAFDVVIEAKGITVSRKMDLVDAEDEIKSMFDTQSDFYQVSQEGVTAECGLDDVLDIIQNWNDIL